MSNNAISLELKFSLYTLAVTALGAAWAFIYNFNNKTFAISIPVGQFIVAVMFGYVAFNLFVLIRERLDKSLILVDRTPALAGIIEASNVSVRLVLHGV